MTVDLKKEQKSSLERPRYKYSLAAKIFFGAMDILAGKKITLPKAKLIEILASIPYRAWEFRQYSRLTRNYRNQNTVQKAWEIMKWSREAQDNEYLHLLVINEKMKEENLKDPWYLFPVFPFFIAGFYVFLTRLSAWIHIRRAFLFNAEFEDHAEHEYARFVEEHPEWEQQPVKSDKVKEYADLPVWADVFRRIGLDERDHMNHSFILCGIPENAVKYNGMPDY
ncbi:MAG: hypothetical protein ACOC5U_04245 [Candidatus Aminicenantaceae bacterium]